MSGEKTKGARGLLVKPLSWLLLLSILALSVYVSNRFHSLLLGIAVFVGIALLLGYISDKMRDRRPLDRTPIPPKTSVGPDTSLKEFPLLYLYFDDFAEMETAWRNGRLESAKQESYRRSREYSMNQIMSNLSLFSDLYRENLVRIRLNDGTVLCREAEIEYWDRATGCKSDAEELHDTPEGLARILRESDNEMEPTVQAIRRRYSIEKPGAGAAGHK